MRLPRMPMHPAGLAFAAIAAAFILAGPAAAHEGPVDTSGGHYCTQAQAASNLCTPGGTYHRHDDDGDIVVVTPGPEAAQLTGQQTGTAQPFTPGGTPTPTTAVPADPTPGTTPPNPMSLRPLMHRRGVVQRGTDLEDDLPGIR